MTKERTLNPTLRCGSAVFGVIGAILSISAKHHNRAKPEVKSRVSIAMARLIVKPIVARTAQAVACQQGRD
jgi:uncharacterized membrane protein YsdA (DUF1294 family)